MKDQRTNRDHNGSQHSQGNPGNPPGGKPQHQDHSPASAGESARTEHPFYGNPYTNVGSAGTPEAPGAKRDRHSDDRPGSGPQLLDDDYYFG